jgi:hypothetical protein
VKTFAGHLVHGKTGTGAGALVASGTRIRWSVRAGGSAAARVGGGSEYVSPRRKSGTAAARFAPGGELTLHEYVQFGRVDVDEPAAPLVVADFPVLQRVAVVSMPVPAVIDGASSPASAHVVPETGGVTRVVWWGGSDE